MYALTSQWPIYLNSRLNYLKLNLTGREVIIDCCETYYTSL